MHIGSILSFAVLAGGAFAAPVQQAPAAPEDAGQIISILRSISQQLNGLNAGVNNVATTAIQRGNIQAAGDSYFQQRANFANTLNTLSAVATSDPRVLGFSDSTSVVTSLVSVLADLTELVKSIKKQRTTLQQAGFSGALKNSLIQDKAIMDQDFTSVGNVMSNTYFAFVKPAKALFDSILNSGINAL